MNRWELESGGMDLLVRDFEGVFGGEELDLELEMVRRLARLQLEADCGGPIGCAVIVDRLPCGSVGPGEIHRSNVVRIPSDIKRIARAVGGRYVRNEAKGGRNNHVNIGIELGGVVATVTANLDTKKKRGTTSDSCIVSALAQLGCYARKG